MLRSYSLAGSVLVSYHLPSWALTWVRDSGLSLLALGTTLAVVLEQFGVVAQEQVLAYPILANLPLDLLQVSLGEPQTGIPLAHARLAALGAVWVVKWVLAHSQGAGPLAGRANGGVYQRLELRLVLRGIHLCAAGVLLECPAALSWWLWCGIALACLLWAHAWLWAW